MVNSYTSFSAEMDPIQSLPLKLSQTLRKIQAAFSSYQCPSFLRLFVYVFSYLFTYLFYWEQESQPPTALDWLQAGYLSSHNGSHLCKRSQASSSSPKVPPSKTLMIIPTCHFLLHSGWKQTLKISAGRKAGPATSLSNLRHHWTLSLLQMHLRH